MTLWRALVKWEENHIYAIRMQNLSAKVISRWTHMTVWRALDTWASHMQMLRRYPQFCACLFKFACDSSLAPSLAHRLDGLRRGVIMRLLNHTLWLGFNTLHENLLRRRRSLDKAGGFLHRWKTLSLSKGFNKWQENHEYMVRMRTVISRALARWLSKSLSSAFKTVRPAGASNHQTYCTMLNLLQHARHTALPPAIGLDNAPSGDSISWSSAWCSQRWLSKEDGLTCSGAGAVGDAQGGAQSHTTSGLQDRRTVAQPAQSRGIWHMAAGDLWRR